MIQIMQLMVFEIKSLVKKQSYPPTSHRLGKHPFSENRDYKWLVSYLQVKTHLQARANQAIAVGTQHPHDSMSKGFKMIFKKEGVKGIKFLER